MFKIDKATSNHVPISFQWAKVVGLSTTLATIVAFLCLLSFFHSQTLSSQDELFQANMLVQSASKTADVLESLERQLLSQKSTLESQRAKFPHRTDISKILKQVAATFEQHDVTIRDFRPSSKVELKHYSEHGIIIQAEGEYKGIMQALDELLRSPWHTRIAGVSIASSAIEDRLSVQVTLAIASELKI